MGWRAVSASSHAVEGACPVPDTGAGRRRAKRTAHPTSSSRPYREGGDPRPRTLGRAPQQINVPRPRHPRAPYRESGDPRPGPLGKSHPSRSTSPAPVILAPPIVKAGTHGLDRWAGRTPADQRPPPPVILAPPIVKAGTHGPDCWASRTPVDQRTPPPSSSRPLSRRRGPTARTVGQVAPQQINVPRPRHPREGGDPRPGPLGRSRPSRSTSPAPVILAPPTVKAGTHGLDRWAGRAPADQRPPPPSSSRPLP